MAHPPGRRLRRRFGRARAHPPLDRGRYRAGAGDAVPARPIAYFEDIPKAVGASKQPRTVRLAACRVRPWCRCGAAAARQSGPRGRGRLSPRPARPPAARSADGVQRRARAAQARGLVETCAARRFQSDRPGFPGATVNDVLVATATGALRRYLEARGEPTGGVSIRASVPVNLRPLDDAHKLANSFGLVFLTLPVGTVDPVKRLRSTKKEMVALTRSPEALV